MMMFLLGEKNQGKITRYQEKAYIPRQSSLVVQAQEWSWTWSALPELWRVLRRGVIVGPLSIV